MSQHLVPVTAAGIALQRSAQSAPPRLEVTNWRPYVGLVGVLLTQRIWDSPEPPAVLADFWTSAYAAIDD